ncbi:MAG: DUF1028 domain-containing protein [Planctomycetes bacterium]|nr:DUF1028 domain-containing protein [Planctomycetota bacterium]
MFAHALQTAARAARHHLLAAGLAASLLAAPAFATWSIILVDLNTGEVAIGNATCITNFDLEKACPVVVVGKGGACAQSLVDNGATARVRIWNGFRNEKPLPAILADIQGIVSAFQFRQYGMVCLYGGGDQLTFTGTACGQWAGGAVGQIGSIRYAIQGNVLTGAPVVQVAEQAVLNTPGSLADKVMAAMQAAKSMGGDGRCSCSTSAPTSCGAPPPSFTKSAHVGYMIVARIGDVDGSVCNGTLGCATGQYYMNLNVIGGAASPDPVDTLTTQYAAFKAGWIGHGDHILTEKSFDKVGLPADGASIATLTLTLKDIAGTALATGGATVTVAHAPGSAGSSTFGAPIDLGNGQYKIPVTAGLTPGMDKLRVVINDGKGNVTLYPYPALPIGAACSPFGVGTPGTASLVPRLDCSAAPLVGSAEFGFTVADFAPTTTVALFASAAQAAIPFGTTGLLLADPNLPFWVSNTFATDAAGAGQLPVPLPSDPTLSGLKCYVQGFGLDAGAELGASATQGVVVEFL